MQKIKIKMAIEVNFVILLIVSLLEEIFAHGVMQSPPARNYMWRLGFNTERNYDDMGLNCGGFSVNIILFSSRNMTKPTKWHVRPAKTQISPGIRPV